MSVLLPGNMKAIVDRLAKAYDINYTHLMELACYVDLDADPDEFTKSMESMARWYVDLRTDDDLPEEYALYSEYVTGHAFL